MAIQLVQSGAGQRVALGPFLDDTDGKTQETGLSIANTNIKIWKNDATALVNKNSGGATHMANGIYYITLDATDTDIPGRMIIFCHMAGALPVRVECHVNERSEYYKKYNYWQSVAMVQATGTPTTTTVPFVMLYPDAAASSVNDDYVGQMLYILAHGLGYTGGFVTRITGYNGTTKTATVSPPFPTAPGSGEYFMMMAGAPGVLDASAVTSIKSGLALDSTVAKDATVAKDSTVAKDATVAKAAALQAVDDLVDDLETRLTAARAGYLDNLNSGVTLTAGAIDAIVDEVIEGSTTLRQALRLILATAAGKSSGGGTSVVTFRDMADSKNRISASVDANGNRTSVTRDAS